MRRLVGEVAAVGVVVMMALVSLGPILQRPARMADYGSDGWLINWIINNNAKKITGNIRNCEGGWECVFGGNIFYPYENVLAYSDMYWMSGFLIGLGGEMSKNMGSTTGVVMVWGQLATMLVIYMWIRELGGGKWAGVMATVALGWSQLRWHYQVHLQMWSMQYWLLGVYLVVTGLKKNSNKRMFWGAVLVGLQAWESLLPIYFSVAMMGIWVWVYRPVVSWKKWVAMALVAGIISGPVMWAYSRVGWAFGYSRSIRDAAHNGLSVEELGGRFASWGLYLLTVVGVLKLGTGKGWSREVKWLVMVGGVGLVMALGPVLKWRGATVKPGGVPVPLPYAAAYYTVPGFGALRTPSRWLWLTGFAMAGVAALGWGKGRSKYMWWGLVGALVVAVGGGTSLKRYVDMPTLAEIPAVYKWMAGAPGEVIVELPMGRDEDEGPRMYYSLYHDKSLVGGFSGFYPPERAGLAKRLNEGFPNKELEKELKDLGVDLVVVDRERWENVEEVEEWAGGRIIFSDEKNLVVRI